MRIPTRLLRSRGRNQPVQAKNDQEVVEQWLNTLNPSTRTSYVPAIEAFQKSLDKKIKETTIGDLQAFMSNLSGAPATRARMVAAIRGLFRFAAAIGYLGFNPADVLKPPRLSRDISKRYLSEEQVRACIQKEDDPRNRLILQTLYSTGLRVSEMCGLRWKDFEVRSDLKCAQAVIHGKGGKVRTVVLPDRLWKALQQLREQRKDRDPVFLSRTGRALERSQVLRIVRNAAHRAGISKQVSPHWLRHAHATHALANGAPLHVVQQSLGHSTLAVTGLYLHSRPTESSSLFLK